MVLNNQLKSCGLLYILLTSIYFGPGAITFIIDSLAFPVSLFALYSMYMYFKTRPYVHQTVIIGQLKMMVFFIFLGLIRTYAESMLFNIFGSWTNAMFRRFPALMCSLTTPKWILTCHITTLSLLSLSKTALVLFPHHFFNLNHEKHIKISLGITIVTVLTNICFNIGVHGHNCNTGYFIMLTESYGVKADISSFVSMPWIQILIIFSGEVISLAVQKYRAWKRRRQVMPIQNIQISLVPTNSDHAEPVSVPGGWMDNQEEENQDSGITLSRNITVSVAFIHIVLSLILNSLTDFSSHFLLLKQIAVHCKMAILRFEMYVLPIAWILSIEETKTFSYNKLKEFLTQNFWPQTMIEYFSSNL